MSQRKTKFVKASIAKLAETLQTPVFPKTLHHLRPNPKAATPQKRDNTFSKSRDMYEDRGSRQMKTTHNSQTFFRMCGNF
jgi:hypothetical protein